MIILHSLGAGLLSVTLALARRVALALLFFGAGLVPVQPCSGASGVFIQTGGLATARYSHTATLLPNGKTLVAGGIANSGGSLASAELYDPASGMWTATGSLVNARDSHTATLLPNGKVLIAGGVGTGGSLASAELYNPASGTWMATGSLASARYYFTMTLLPDGKVLAAGGINFTSGSLASAELYDPASGIWSTTGSLTTPRDVHTATLLPSGKVLVAGGAGPGLSFQSSELYDPASGTWSAIGNLVTKHIEHTATLLPNGKVLVAGSNACCVGDAELYDPASGTWSATGNLVTPRTEHTATLLPNGKVLVVAGENDGFILGSAELYDPATGTWMATGNMMGGRTNHTATLLPNDEVLVVGGTIGFGFVLSSAELYIAEPTPPTFLNLSTRLRVLTGNNVLIGGFIITGTDPKNVLIRAIGPSLSRFGVAGILADPTLELHQGSTTVAINDNWKVRPDGSSQQAEIEATGIPPTNDLESAILATLSPGAYTAILAGNNGGTGVGSVEVYDLGQEANSKLANLSTRGFVDTGDNVMIAGLILGGGTAGVTSRVMVRALGPSVPVPGALSDPTLELRDGNGTLIASNDNWKMRPDGSSQQAEIEATGVPPTNDLESAVVRTLSPGNFTAIVHGTNNTIGVGLVEVYNLQ